LKGVKTFKTATAQDLLILEAPKLFRHAGKQDLLVLEAPKLLRHVGKRLRSAGNTKGPLQLIIRSVCVHLEKRNTH